MNALAAIIPSAVMCAIFVGVMRTLFKSTRARGADGNGSTERSSAPRAVRHPDGRGR